MNIIRRVITNIYNYIERFINVGRWEKRLLKMEYELLEKSRNMQTLTRLALGGFDPSYLDSELFEPFRNISSVEEEQRALNNEDQFLINIHELSKNDAVLVLMKWVIRNTILFIAKEADSMESINFNRATIAGIYLFKEEIDRLNALYLSKHEKPESFDKFDVLYDN